MKRFLIIAAITLGVMGSIEGSNALFQSSIPEVKSPLYLESYISQADEITDDEDVIINEEENVDTTDEVHTVATPSSLERAEE